MGRRAEPRIEISLRVRVWGMDRNGKPFIKSVYTADITRSGARLRDLFCLDRAGEVIRIQHGLKKANFTIQWIGHPGTARGGEAGIHSMDPERYIWGVPLPQATPIDIYEVKTPKSPFLSPGNVSAFAALSPAPLAAETAKVTRIEGRSGEMRAATRYACNGTAEVGPEGGSIPIWCGLSDISISGCYAETTSPLPVDTRVYVRLKIFGVQVQSLGTVRTTHHGVGMGISFAEMGDEDQVELRSILQGLAVKPQNGEAAFAPNLNSVLLAPIPSPALLHDRSLLLVHNRPQTESAKKTAPVADPQIAHRLEQLVREFEELPAALRPEIVDPRILQEFKNSVDHARRAAGAVQQWMELQSQNRDPFQALHKLNEDRVRVVAGLNHRISMDVDAGDIDLDNNSLNELYESTKDLYARLQKLFKKW